MKKLLRLTSLGVFLAGAVNAQNDSTVVQAHAKYNTVSGTHRKFFGENYRKEWATPVTVPLIKISALGLKPTELGGGKQTKSLRLEDAEGKEWVIRSIEKNPEIILPEPWRQTFAKDWVVDAMSSQHPYSPLIIPVLADAIQVPHTNPVIGMIAPDSALGQYEKTFANTLCLLEEREPTGKSDNTAKMLDKLDETHRNRIDTFLFFRARLLDFFVGDWDRHNDQWRWVDKQEGDGRQYIAVPRDRDQVLKRSQGVMPTLVSRKWIAPQLTGFKGKVKRSSAAFFNGANLNGRLLMGLTYEQWMQQTREFVAAMTDEVLEKALQRLPPPVYKVRHDELLRLLKQRRGNMEKGMAHYYYFLNRIIDLKMSDKAERVAITDGADGGTQVTINTKDGDPIFNRNFLPHDTKELRIFIGGGKDSVVVNAPGSKIKTRIIGGDGEQAYNVLAARKRPFVYDKPGDFTLYGKARRRISNDSLNTAFVQTNLYDVVFPLVTAGFNIDDGFLIGGGLRYTRRSGFRKKPYAEVQQLTAAYSFTTSALRVRYRGEWIRSLGKADITLNAYAFAPNNTTNFFGRGNETEYVKVGEHRKFYRIRYNTFFVNPSIRWNLDSSVNLSVGPAFQYYNFDSSDNVGRFINNKELIHSYDSNTVSQAKAHAGVIIAFISDKRNSPILTQRGYYLSIKAQGYMGLNDYAEDFVQIIPELAVYKNLFGTSSVVISDRVGGTITMGKTAFYQSAFLGGHENLLGYRQYRFAGQHSMYNNLELRIGIADIASYILPGQLGLTGFFDIGRVWEKNEDSKTWHQGVGGGLFFSPAQMAMFQFVMGYSKEGWYPYFTMGFRF